MVIYISIYKLMNLMYFRLVYILVHMLNIHHLGMLYILLGIFDMRCFLIRIH